MSQSIYPTLITNTFIPSLWRSSTGQSITTSYLNSNYVRFPIAQGSQSFPSNLSVTGITNLGETNLQTKNTNQPISHYLNFSDSSSTSVGAIQKSANFSVVPSTGAFTVSGLITAGGGLAAATAITANAGLTMGGTSHITLGTNTSSPSSTQIGYSITTNIPTNQAISSSLGPIGSMSDTIVGRGVWAVTVNAVLEATSSTTTVPFFQLYTSPNGTTFTIQNDTFCPSCSTSGPLYSSCSMSNIFTFTSANNYLTLYAGTLGGIGSSKIEITQRYNYLKVVRIA